MKNLFIYLATVFIWGTTWLAIKLQLGDVSPEVLIFYRFLFAFSLLLVFCKIKGMNLKFRFKDHVFFFLLGLCMFSVHLLFIYTASLYLISGMVSILFSLVSLFNILNSFLIFKKKPEIQVLFGACLGLAGTVVFFWDEVGHLSFQSQAILGAGYALIGTLLFSLGNMVSMLNIQHKLPLIPSTTLSMGYGASIMLVFCLLNNASFTLPTNAIYWGSLLYLVFIGSIAGFLCFLSLVSRIGPAKAGYATVFFPIIALFVSMLFENYSLSLTDLIGIGCVFAGNFLVMFKKKTVLT